LGRKNKNRICHFLDRHRQPFERLLITIVVWDYPMRKREVVLGRVPPDVKAWLRKQAEIHYSSQNAVLIAALRAAMIIEAERRQARAAATAE